MRSVLRLTLVLACALICIAGVRWPIGAAAQAPAPPTATPPPDQGPPLALRGSATAAQVDPGQSFTYTVVVSSHSSTPRQVELRVTLDPRLQLVGAGPCRGGAPVVCSLSVSRDRPASAALALRVRADVARGASVELVALAQDDLLNTAASDRVTVGVAARQVSSLPADAVQPVRPTLAPVAPQPGAAAAPRARAADRSSADAPAADPPSDPAAPAAGAQAAPAPASPSDAGAEAAVIVMPAGELAGASLGDAPAPAAAAAVADAGPVGEPAAALAEPAAPPQPAGPAPIGLAPAEPRSDRAAQPQPAAAPAPWRGAPLPNTALLPNTLGALLGLVGLALILHGVRGARQTAAQIERQARGLRRLAALGAALRGRPAGERAD